MYDTPILIVGAGYGGISSALLLLRSGRDNFIMVERRCKWYPIV